MKKIRAGCKNNKLWYLVEEPNAFMLWLQNSWPSLHMYSPLLRWNCNLLNPLYKDPEYIDKICWGFDAWICCWHKQGWNFSGLGLNFMISTCSPHALVSSVGSLAGHSWNVAAEAWRLKDQRSSRITATLKPAAENRKPWTQITLKPSLILDTEKPRSNLSNISWGTKGCITGIMMQNPQKPLNRRIPSFILRRHSSSSKPAKPPVNNLHNRDTGSNVHNMNKPQGQCCSGRRGSGNSNRFT